MSQYNGGSRNSGLLLVMLGAAWLPLGVMVMVMVMVMGGRGSSVRQTSHRLLCEALRGVLLSAMESGTDAVGSVQCRAVAALYEVLMNHPVDRRGRCRSCRRPGAVLGRQRRRCRVHSTADYWLHHPDADFLLTHLAREFAPDTGPHTGNGAAPGPQRATGTNAGDRDDTDLLPKITTEPSFPQSPVVSSPPFLPGGFPRARRPDPDHGEVRESPEDHWPRRGPFKDPNAEGLPVPSRSLLVSRGAT